MDIENARRLAGRLAFIDQSPRKGDLVGIELRRTAEAHTACSGRHTPCAGPLGNQGTLEFGDAGEHGQDHAAGRRGGVGPGFGERAESGAGHPKLLGNVEKVTGRSGESVEAGDRDDIVGPEVVDQPCQLRPVAFRPGDLLLVDP